MVDFILFNFILFDLDGVLTDSKEEITKSVQYTLSKMDIQVEMIRKEWNQALETFN